MIVTHGVPRPDDVHRPPVTTRQPEWPIVYPTIAEYDLTLANLPIGAGRAFVLVAEAGVKAAEAVRTAATPDAWDAGTRLLRVSGPHETSRVIPLSDRAAELLERHPTADDHRMNDAHRWRIAVHDAEADLQPEHPRLDIARYRNAIDFALRLDGIPPELSRRYLTGSVLHPDDCTAVRRALARRP